MNSAFARPRILFVDDEPRILQGLKRLLHPMREQWEAVFVGGGEEALSTLRAGHFDMGVSDLRMPGLDGAQLLSRVSRLYPDMIRFVLSGHADKDMIVRSVGSAHQFLAKPCDPETMRQAISNAFSLRGVLRNSAIKALMGSDCRLPILPETYQELISVLRDSDVGIERVATIVSHDLVLSAKVLQLVNSAFFGLRKHVESIRQAVAYLGVEVISMMTLASGAFEQFSAAEMGDLDIHALYNHSVAVGEVAGRLIQIHSKDNRIAAEAILAGLLHDFGKLLLLKNKSERWRCGLALAAAERKPVFIVEKEQFGVCHAEVGAYLLGLWGMSDNVVEAVAFHHFPSSCNHRKRGCLFALHLANAFCHKWQGETDWACYLDSSYIGETDPEVELKDYEEAARPSLTARPGDGP